MKIWLSTAISSHPGPFQMMNRVSKSIKSRKWRETETRTELERTKKRGAIFLPDHWKRKKKENLQKWQKPLLFFCSSVISISSECNRIMQLSLLSLMSLLSSILRRMNAIITGPAFSSVSPWRKREPFQDIHRVLFLLLLLSLSFLFFLWSISNIFLFHRPFSLRLCASIWISRYFSLDSFQSPRRAFIYSCVWNSWRILRENRTRILDGTVAGDDIISAQHRPGDNPPDSTLTGSIHPIIYLDLDDETAKMKPVIFSTKFLFHIFKKKNWKKINI